MVDLATKKKLIKELESNGNVYVSCTKIGINRSTYYRWLGSDKVFQKLSKRALQMGRKNMCDIAEYSLMKNIKEGKMDAIKHFLSHNDPRYKPKMRKVFIEHSNFTKDLHRKFDEEDMKKINEIAEDVRVLGETLRAQDDSDVN